MYGKVCNVRKTLDYIKYVNDIINIELNNPNKVNIENDDISYAVQTQVVSSFANASATSPVKTY